MAFTRRSREVTDILGRFQGATYFDILNRLWRMGLPVDFLTQGLATTERGSNDPADIVARLLNRGMAPEQFATAATTQVEPDVRTPFTDRGMQGVVHRDPAPPPPPAAPPASARVLPGDVRAAEHPAPPPRPTQPLRPPAPAPTGTLGGGTRSGPASPGLANLPTLPPNASDEQVEAYIRRNYGFSAWALDIPELRPLLRDLAREFAGAPDIDEARIEGRLSATEWWKTHTDVQRQKIEERGEDPATYNAGVESSYRTLNLLMGQLGFTVPEGRLREIARTSYEMGWQTAEQRAALAAEFDYDPDTGAQEQSAVVGDLRNLAADYLVPLSESTIDAWGRQIIAGTSRNEDFTEYAKGMAKGMFAHYAGDIDAGRTIRQIADPFVETAARDLELTPDQIDLMDPKWRKALELDPETGQPMQLSKWARTIRSDSSYGWDGTGNAREEAAEFTRKILESFGRL